MNNSPTFSNSNTQPRTLIIHIPRVNLPNNKTWRWCIRHATTTWGDQPIIYRYSDDYETASIQANIAHDLLQNGAIIPQ